MTPCIVDGITNFLNSLWEEEGEMKNREGIDGLLEYSFSPCVVRLKNLSLIPRIHSPDRIMREQEE